MDIIINSIIAAIIIMGIIIILFAYGFARSIKRDLFSHVDSLENHLMSRLDKSESNLSSRPDKLENNLNSRLDKVENNLSPRLDRLEAKAEILQQTVTDVDKGLYAVETVLHMKDRDSKQDQNVNKPTQ